MARTYAGRTLDELEQLLLAAVLRATAPTDGSRPNMGAAQVARGLISELREREREDDREAAKLERLRKARARRPEKMTYRHRLLWALRTYQEIIDTSDGDVARVHAQRHALDILQELELIEGGKVTTDMEAVMRERLQRAGMLEGDEDGTE